MWWTIISSILTAVSIVFSCISMHNAKKAKQYKDEVINLKDAIEIKGVSEIFKEARLKFLQETRMDEWYRGKDVNTVISPMESTLAKLDAVYPLMNDAQKLKDAVKTATKHLRQFDKCTKSEKRSTYDALENIGELLQDLLHKQTAEALK